jgi:antitoxin VapB
MYIDDVHINIGVAMALQIANPVVVQKVELMAKRLGLSKTAVVERALDQLISASEGAEHQSERFEALLAQLDRIADRPDAYDPLHWDERGLPT